MLSSYIKALDQLSDPAIRRVLWVSIAIAAAVFAVLWGVIDYLLANTALFETGWLEWASDALGYVATLALTWFLFPGVVSAAVGVLLEAVAAAVEARHYAHLAPAPGLPLGQSVLGAVRFLAALIAVNVLILPFLLIAPVFPFVFYAANGYLLGREYFELVALRRVGQKEARALRKANRGRLFVFGAVTAFLLTVPVINLLTPVVACAAMVHLFEAWRGDPA